MLFRSAKFNLHRNYAEYLIGKGRLRAKQINQILAGIKADKKTAYDEAYIEELYRKFQNHEVDDAKLLTALEEKLKGRKILILAPGASIRRQREEIEAFIKEESPLIFAANFAPADFSADYVFCSNAMRYDALEEKRQGSEVLITSNLTDVCEEPNVLNYADLSFDEKGICDNCVIMLMKLLIRLKAKQVYVAGFDGYQKEGGNYVTSYMASQHTKGMEENIRNRAYVENIRKQIEVVFLTGSLYNG